MMRGMSGGTATTRAGRRRREKLDRRHVVGLPQLRFIEGMLGSLRAAGDHPNRKLFFDDLVIALLLAFYNPVARSLRGVEDASQMPGINQHLDIDAIRRSTASDAMSAFDPQLLVPLIAHLRQQVAPRQMDAADPTLRGLLNRLLAFDGSYFRTAADAGWALRERHGANARLRGRVRLNLHLSVRDGLPAGVSVAGQGDAGETVAVLEGVEAGQIVVADRGCFSHDTVHGLLTRKADLVLRLQRGVRCEVIAERALTQDDRDAGVVGDQTVILGGCKNTHPRVPMRLVTIQPPPEQGDCCRNDASMKSTDSTSSPEVMNTTDACEATHASAGPIRLLTSITDDTVAAWMIGHLYRRRWDIELFFRWLKTCARWEHLMSQSRGGVLIQMYVALIGTLLLSLHTGRQPDRYSYNLMCMVAAGQGSVDDALAILRRRHAERDRDRQRRRQRLQHQPA